MLNPNNQVDAVSEDGMMLKLPKAELEEDRFDGPRRPGVTRTDPVVREDGAAMSEPAESRKGAPDAADTPCGPLDAVDTRYRRLGAEEARVDWATRPR